MSFFEKQRKNRSYVYYQAYGDGKRKVVYLGPRDELATWEKAERLFLEYLDNRLANFYAQVPDELKNRIQPREGIVRPPTAGVPQIEKELIEVSAPTSEMPKRKSSKSRIAINDKEVEAFQRLGLTEYEARLYLVLLKTGPVNASQLSFLGQVPRTRTSTAIKELQRHGLLEALSEKPEIYAPRPPAEVLPARIAKLDSGIRESEKIIRALFERNKTKQGLNASSDRK